MKLIGLTGGIGSGKSTVAEIFRTLGIPVYESDSRAKQLMNSNPEIIEKIKQLLGQSAYNGNTVNTGFIAEQVFKNKPLLQQLNAIVHPAVKQDAHKWAESSACETAPYVLKESAILFEEQLTDDLNAVILIVAPENIRMERIIIRDKVTSQQVQDRMQHQWIDEQKIPLADYVIFNDGERSLIEQVRDIDQMIRLS